MFICRVNNYIDLNVLVREEENKDGQEYFDFLTGEKIGKNTISFDSLGRLDGTMTWDQTYFERIGYKGDPNNFENDDTVFRYMFSTFIDEDDDMKDKKEDMKGYFIDYGKDLAYYAERVRTVRDAIDFIQRFDLNNHF